MSKILQSKKLIKVAGENPLVTGYENKGKVQRNPMHYLTLVDGLKWPNGMDVKVIIGSTVADTLEQLKILEDQLEA